MEMIKVLWIEDGAYTELSLMAGPLYVAGKYDLVIALDATEGLRYLKEEGREFDVIVVDVRLPPGKDEQFVARYDEKGESRVAARLGVFLLDRVLDGDELPPNHPHRDRTKFAVFTAESPSQMKRDLESLHLEPLDEYYFQKTVLNDKNKLRNIIDAVRKRAAKTEG